MRDPVMYRILHATHHRSGDKWCIYPTYDFTHGQSDSIERITHSICTLEFENHRPLYDWYIRELGIFAPQQIEFARLNLTYTVMSKRLLLQLVKEKYVSGWDDPRMPTICGLRRRGYTPEAIRDFCATIGVSKVDSVVDIALLEHCLRTDLNKRAPRVMGVLAGRSRSSSTTTPRARSRRWTRSTIPRTRAWARGKSPSPASCGSSRTTSAKCRRRNTTACVPARKCGSAMRIWSRCTRVVKDPASGEVAEVHCTYDPATRGGNTPDGRKVKGTIHWVSAAHAVPAEVRLYDHLFTKPDPGDVPEGQDYKVNLNPKSLERLTGCFVEPSLKGAAPGSRFQFERLGYFCVDPDSTPERPVFNRTVSLVDTWAKIEKKG